MIFVTGGTGLVGAHLLYELILAGKKVRALKRKTSNLQQVLRTFSYYSENPEKLFNQIEWVDGDILDYFSLENILSGVSEIYHCAAIISFDPRDRQKMISNNVEGTANLVNAALENGIKKICHVSSVSALGRVGKDEVVTEETKWIPSKKISGYSESKFFSEVEMWRGMEEGVDVVIVNPSIIFGPAGWNSGSAKMFKSVSEGLKFYTRGVTGFVDVKDVVRAMILLMDEKNFEKAKNQRFLLNAENRSYKEVFSQIANALGIHGPNIYVSDTLLQLAWRVVKLTTIITGKPAVITREIVANSNSANYFDGSKIVNQFNFSYIPLEESIKQTAAFLKKDLQNQ